MKPNKFDRIDATKTPKHPAVSLSQTMRRFESEYSLVFYLNFAFFGTAVGITWTKVAWKSQNGFRKHAAMQHIHSKKKLKRGNQQMSKKIRR